MAATDLSHAFCDNMIRNVERCVAKIKHCTNQLNDEQIWWRPDEAMNSIGNILLHLCGNMTQWIIHGVRAEPDSRNRPQEFAQRDPVVKAQLLQQLDDTVQRVKTVLGEVREKDLLQPRRIQGFEETVLSAVTDSTHHLAGHTQEIIYITRLQLGSAYQFAWKPASKEEGL